jgi:hypothetical protein
VKRYAPSHRDDPATSRLAASRVPVARQRFLVLEALANATRPLTNDEIHYNAARFSPFYKECQPHALSTRRGVLQANGLVRKVDNLGLSAFGNPAGRYEITHKGRAEYSKLKDAMHDRK